MHCVPPGNIAQQIKTKLFNLNKLIMRKKLLNITLFSALLGAGLLAYADGEVREVKLTDGTSISWASFVEAIKSGKAADISVMLPANDPAVVALKNAEQKVTDAQAAVTLAEGVVTEKETAVTTAKGTVDAKKALVAETSQLYTDSVNAEKGVADAQLAIDNYVKNNITPIENQIASNNATIAANKEKITNLQTDQLNLQSELTTAQGNRTKANEAIATAKEAINTQVTTLTDQLNELKEQLQVLKDTLSNENKIIDNVNSQIAALPKKTGTVGWLADIEKYAKNVEDEWADLTPESTTIICWRSVTSSGMTKTTTLYLYFGNTEPSDANTWRKGTLADFYYYLFGNEDADPVISPATVNRLVVYLGPEGGNYTVTSYAGNSGKDNLISNAYGAIQNLASQSDYKVQTDELQNPQAEVDLKAQITAYTEKYITPTNDAIAEKNGEISAKNTEISNKKGELTSPPAGSDLAKAKADYDNYNDEIDGENGLKDQLASVKSQIQGLQNENTNLNNQINNEYEIIKENGETVKMPSLKDQLEAAETTGRADVDNALTTAKETAEAANAALATARAEVTAAEKAVTDAEAEVATAESDLGTKEAAVTAAEGEKETATANLAAAQTAANEAAAEQAFAANYKNVSLNENVTVTSAITPVNGSNYDGNINGNGKIITVETESNYIFSTPFTGFLNNVAVNGGIASTTSRATIDNVVIWNGSEGEMYDAKGNNTSYTSLAELGYAARAKYGISFESDNLVTLTNQSKVFKVTVNNLEGNIQKDVESLVVINDKGEMINGTSNGTSTQLALPVNTFAQCANADVANLEVELTNVYYGANNTCKKVVITDQNNFYCPVNIQANKVSYTRKLKAGYNSVCLPFALDRSKLPTAVEAVCPYDTETEEKFWFTKVAGDVPANEPVLLIANAECSIELYDGAVIAPTPANLLVAGGTNANEEYKSQSHGTYKKVNAGEFLGESKANSIYGLQTVNGKQVFQRASSTAQFYAFRMALSSMLVPSAREANAPGDMPVYRQIGILDEFGNDITNDVITGVEGVSAATDFSVVAGQGEIIFNSDSNYGKVEIFSLDGRVAAVADVLEGTTSVNVVKGIYIVMGKKVMVK